MPNLVKLHKDLNGELGADGPAGHEFVKRLGEAGADGGPPVQLEGGHPLQRLNSVRTRRGESHTFFRHSDIQIDEYGHDDVMWLG